MAESSQRRVSLNEQVLTSMRKAKVFKLHERRVNSMDFSSNGEVFISSGDDESLQLYSAVQGKHLKTIPVKKYGTGLVRFTHHNSAVICASQNNFDHSLRYLSIHENRYLRYFQGHCERVISLAMSPRDDTFFSSSLDKSIRFWDLRDERCQGILRCHGRGVVDYDPEGVVFGVAYSEGRKLVIKLFDLRQFYLGPFYDTTRDVPTTAETSCLKFSKDGRFMLVTTAEPQPKIQLFDAIEPANLLFTYTGHSNDESNYLEASFTPDSKQVLSGSEDGSIFIWSTTTGKHIVTLTGHEGPVCAVKWNPQYAMMASACQNVVFWLPSALST
ncbi:hypothetical protein GAYE_SCF08G3095 [Galdieria yellowstonensis]|uniref:Uncharacterized protein n=1 Tax=Galdieria yellowstonensis TaxID=3028027 RepID=A0AAV9ICP2_9RHOD|nr:hypothetical protein GAYE_SCF08G3095 [Galdieria yellowstonensis]